MKFRNVGGNASTSAPGGDIELEDISPKHNDDQLLARIGKKQVLKRNFGFMSILGFSCTVLITWEGFLVVFASGFKNGGPAGIVYGYILVWIGTLSTFATLSELTSMAPTSGGQYHWVAMLAPPRYQRFLSYVTGWLTVLGWQAFVASDGYLNGTMAQGLIVLADVNYDFKAWHGMLLYWGIVLFAVFINTVVSSLLPKFEGLILIIHILGFFAIIFPLIILGPHGDASSVFQSFINGGNWPTDGLSFFVGLLGNVFAFFGADAAIHMSEEIQGAAVVVPRSIMMSIILNGSMGFGMALALLFCIGDVEAALASPTGFPFIEIFYQAVQSRTGASLMTAVILTLAVCATVGTLASASRQLWSFSRDRAVPGWSYLQRVNSKTAVPVAAVIVSTIFSCSLALIILGSSTVFNDVVSLSVVGLFGSYFLAAFLLLWRRLKGDIGPYQATSIALSNIPGAPLSWGPWRVPGKFGIINNIFTVCYLVVIWFFSFWPPELPVEASTMNYGSLMLGATMIFSVVYYFIWARRVYKGPVVEL